MAVPGFSVTDLIQALGQAKLLYDAFFDKYTNSAVQVKHLADDIKRFQANLQEHINIVERGGLEYSGYAAASQTLASCYCFLHEYKDILVEPRRKSPMVAYQTAKFTLDQKEVTELRAQIERHKTDMLHSSINVLL